MALGVLRRRLDGGIATMAAELMALDHISGQRKWTRRWRRQGASTQVVARKIADRLPHNMQTLQFPCPRQTFSRVPPAAPIP